MKLYIPTCTLNFNNIFTTESISPASHYSNRGFGNKRYFKVEANDLDNVVMLYSKYPLFKINDGDMENSPMVIEIESDDYLKEQFVKVGEKDGIESYASNTSIYLNPYLYLHRASPMCFSGNNYIQHNLTTLSFLISL